MFSKRYAVMMESTREAPLYQTVKGFQFGPMFDRKTIEAALNYEARADDVFIVTYPKSGTTWVQQICNLLFNDGYLPKDANFPYDYSPFLEAMGPNAVKNMKRPGVIKTHLPLSLMPYHPQAKYIYVTRNPKDACVSFYHHSKLFKQYMLPKNFHDYMMLWLRGEVSGGSYVDHVLPWWQHRQDDNILCLLYEDMKEDVRMAIQKIARFIGKPYLDKVLSDAQFVHRIVRNSSISSMKRTVNGAFAQWANAKGILNEGSGLNLVRKGIIGDWRNHFKVEDSKVFDQWFFDNFRGTDLEHVWDKYTLIGS